MGIKLHTVKLLTDAIAHLPSLDAARLLVIGVQDCFFTYDALLTFLTKHRIRHTPVPADERQVTTGFVWEPAESHVYRNCVHAHTVFRVLGFSFDHVSFMDFSPYEGADIIHDLNVPVPDALRSRFDVVLDFGTAEHVFSVKECLSNLATLCDLGGLLITLHPVDWVNHGFYNFNAALIGDFFSVNGFDVVNLRYIATPRNGPMSPLHYLELPPAALKTSLAPSYMTELYSVLRKRQHTPLTIPMQGRYERLWAIKQECLPPNNRSNGFKFSEAAKQVAKRIAARSSMFSYIAYTHIQRARAKKVRL